MLGKTSWYSIDVSGNDRCHVALLQRKYHFCHLLPFAKVYRAKCISHALTTSSHLSFIFSISETAFWRNVWKVTSNSGSSWRSFCHRMYNSSYLYIWQEDNTCEIRRNATDFQVYLYPPPQKKKWYVKGTHFRSSMHKHSVKNIHQVMKKKKKMDFKV